MGLDSFTHDTMPWLLGPDTSIFRGRSYSAETVFGRTARPGTFDLLNYGNIYTLGGNYTVESGTASTKAVC
ncbi:MAG: hypothetical protein ACLRSW_03505 [Christensenellaceae bacterium]